MIEPILLAVTCVATFEAQQAKTNATGFFFKRGQRLFIVTSRHVLIDEPTRHFPTGSRQSCTSIRTTWRSPSASQFHCIATARVFGAMGSMAAASTWP